MKQIYEKIAKAIYIRADKENLDVKELLREWIMLFEKTKVENWDRMEFLDCCVIEVDRRIEKAKNGNING